MKGKSSAFVDDATTAEAVVDNISDEFVGFSVEGIYDDLIVYFFVYANIIVTLVLWLCYFGLDVNSAIRSVSAAMFSILAAVLVFRFSYRRVPLTAKHFLATLLIVILEASIALTLVFNPVFFERTGLVVAASLFVGVRFATLPLVARTLTILVVVSLFVTIVPLVAAWVRSDIGVVSIPLLAGTQISAFIIGVLGFWIIYRRRKEYELRHRLGDLSRQLYADNLALEQAIGAEKSANTRAEKEAAHRARLLSYIVHDVRQPISALSYMLFSLQRQASAGQTLGGKELEECQACVESAKSLIDDIVTLERSKVTPPSLQIRSIELKSIFEQLGSEFGERFAEKGISFDVTKTDAVVFGDPLCLLRILRNLLTNVIKHACASKVTLMVVQEGQTQNVIVTDDGVGYKPSRHQTGEQAVFSESGIGLKITERLATAMQSSLDIEALASGGTRCSLKIPVHS